MREDRSKTKVVATREFNSGIYHFKQDDEIYIVYDNSKFSDEEHEYFIVPYIIKESILESVDDDKDGFNIIEEISTIITDDTLIREQTEKELLKDDIYLQLLRVAYYDNQVKVTKKNIEFFVDQHQKEQFSKYLNMYETNLKESREKLKEMEKEYENML